MEMGILMMRSKYGVDGKMPKEYHNEEHAKMAVENGMKLARLENVPALDRFLVGVAMAFHDVDSESGPDLSEERSAKIAEEVMREEISSDDVEIIKEMILATKYSFVDGVMYQEVEYKEGEEKKRERIAKLKKIAADSDLSGLGLSWDIYSKAAFRLGRELGKLPKKDKPSKGELRDFWQWQGNFISGIQKRGFYTKGATSLFSNLDENVRRTLALAKAV